MVLEDITNNPDINYDSLNIVIDYSYDSDEDDQERPKRCLGLCVFYGVMIYTDLLLDLI